MDLTLPQCVYQTVLLWIIGFGACLCQIHSGPEETYATNVESKDYCLDEHMVIDCPRGSVAKILSADLGRMSLGRCVKTNYGYVGCASSVKDILDAECTGRTGCKILVNSGDLFRDRLPCPRDFESYLHAKYTCLNVTTPMDGSCRVAARVASGSISGIVTHMTLARGVDDQARCGGLSHPWLFPSYPGQIINITTHIFAPSLAPGLGNNVTMTYSTGVDDDHKISHISTPDGHTVDVVSNGHQVEIRLVDNRGHVPFFLMHYDASVSRMSLLSPYLSLWVIIVPVLDIFYF